MEKQLRTQTINLVANTTVTLTWSGADFQQVYRESIIKKQIAIRFTCSTTAANVVNCGVRYATLNKTYQVSEVKTLFVIPPAGSAEITPASKAALGQLNDWITSISIDLTCASAGTATVTLIIDDEPPPLATDVSNLIGLDAQLADDYLIVFNNTEASVVAAGGSVNFLIYTVPAGKRAYIDSVWTQVEPTPSYPGYFRATVRITVGGNTVDLYAYSEAERWVVEQLVQNFPLPLIAGDSVRFLGNNGDSTTHTLNMKLLGREVF